jgi:methionine-S-sulfoxide reductase
MFRIFTILLCSLSIFACQSQSKKSLPKQKHQVSDSLCDTLVIGGGCFWCTEAIYERLEGVISVESGYAGGSIENPTYEQVCTGRTGHAEAVRLIFDTSKTNIPMLLKVFFTVHDPTTLNRQGADVGTQYRSVIFYNRDNEKSMARQIIEDLNLSKAYEQEIVTTLEPLTTFYPAETYHQDYFENNASVPYCSLVIQPKVDKFEKVFKTYLKH